MGLTINCNTCKAGITKKETVVQCVSCENIKHMTTQCTQLSGTVINALQETKIECTSTMQQLRKNEQTGSRPGRYQQPKQNWQKQQKSGGNENFW